MRFAFLMICLVFVSVAIYCQRPASVEAHPKARRSAEQSTSTNDTHVTFAGVTFSYDKSVFGKLETKIVPEYELQERDDKPDGVAPECRCFTFELGGERQNAILQVYLLDRFRHVYAKNEESVAQISKAIAGLRRVLENEKYRLDGEIPHLPFVDVHQDLQAKVKPFRFKNGKGVLFVMHWDVELNLISNRNLIYRYEGVTTDGEFYITAEMPIKAPFLPDEPPNEFEGFRVWKGQRYTADALDDKTLSAYRVGIAKRLETLSSEDFNPQLKSFEHLISSLSVDKPKH